MLEVVVNVSEGRDERVLDACAAAAGECLLDLHADPWHHRAVFTLAGSQVGGATRALAAEVLAQVDLSAHIGVHPRLGALDVVPFVPLTSDRTVGSEPLDEALAARDAFAMWAGEQLGLPCFHYGPGRSLPEVRRTAFRGLMPDTGPSHPHPTAGACCVGARHVLVAYNLWLTTADLATGRSLAASLRGPHVRALAFQLDDAVQVSCNLLDPVTVGPEVVYDLVAPRADIERTELVGLVPATVLEATPRARWKELDLEEGRTIEARLAEAGLGD